MISIILGRDETAVYYAFFDLPRDDVVDLKSSFLRSRHRRTSFVVAFRLILFGVFLVLWTMILMRQRSRRFPEGSELNHGQMILDLQCSSQNAKDRSEQGENCNRYRY